MQPPTPTNKFNTREQQQQTPCEQGTFLTQSLSYGLSSQSSYCRGVRCACFSKDDKYVFAGMRDRSIIAWSALDGESCFSMEL